MKIWEWCLTHKIEAIIIAAAILAVLITIILLIVFWIRKHNSVLFKFLRYKKYEGPTGNRHQHPKLIVEETEDEYGFMGLTESPKHGRAKNLPIKNPQKGNTRKSHIKKEVRHDVKDNFYDQILRDYKLTKKDKKAIIAYLERRKKKK